MGKMMPALANDKEEALAQELAKGATQALAWINAGFPAKNNSVASVQCNKLLKKKPEINQRVDELRAIARDTILTAKFNGSVEELARLLLEDRQFAREQKQAGAAVSASAQLMKLFEKGADNVKHGASESLERFLDSIASQPRLSNGDR